ncbi:hypothetical protein P4414_17720 [Bacillus thuringiensis]|nr:hypothetical protein [Bacillus thuringiensis]
MACTNGELKCMNGNWYVCENNTWENAGLNGCTLMIPYPPTDFPSQPEMPQESTLDSLDSSGGWTCIWTVKGIRTWIYIVRIDGVNRQIIGYVPIESQPGRYSAYTMTVPFNEIKNFVKDTLTSCAGVGSDPGFPPSESDPKPHIDVNVILACKGYWTFLWTRIANGWVFIKDVITVIDSQGNTFYKAKGCTWYVNDPFPQPRDIEVNVHDITDYYRFINLR